MHAGLLYLLCLCLVLKASIATDTRCKQLETHDNTDAVIMHTIWIAIPAAPQSGFAW